jgi:hypothetical protein
MNMNLIARIVAFVGLAACVGGAPAHALIIGGPGTPNDGNCFPFGCNAPVDWGTEYQQVYASTDFSGTIAIRSISFYDHNFDSGLAATLETGTFTISLSVTSKAVGTLSVGSPAALLSNITGANTPLFTGTLPGSLAFGSQLDFILTSPYFYDPSQGNLLLDVVASPNGHIGDIDTFFDAHNGDFGGLSSRAFVSTDGGAGFDGWGLVTGFNEVPEPGTLAIFATALLGIGLFRRKSLTDS